MKEEWKEGRKMESGRKTSRHRFPTSQTSNFRPLTSNQTSELFYLSFNPSIPPFYSFSLSYYPLSPSFRPPFLLLKKPRKNSAAKKNMEVNNGVFKVSFTSLLLYVSFVTSIQFLRFFLALLLLRSLFRLPLVTTGKLVIKICVFDIGNVCQF